MASCEMRQRGVREIVIKFGLSFGLNTKGFIAIIQNHQNIHIIQYFEMEGVDPTLFLSTILYIHS